METDFEYTHSAGSDERKITVVIGRHKYETGFGPIVKKVYYEKPTSRKEIMDTIRLALYSWYDEMVTKGIQTVKVYITGTPGKWIGNGPTPADRPS